MKSFLLTCLILCVSTGSIVAQKATNVILEQSETLSFDKNKGTAYQVLKGNVRFRHENALMFCDSAYFYDGKNSFDAFGHVKVVQGDSLTLTANKMFYDGNSRLMRALGNVVMDNSNFVLYTENLDFDRAKNFGHYFDGGKIIDPQFELTSKVGYYYPDTKKSSFRYDVVLVNPNFTIKSDTLQFDSRTNIAHLIGPSHIFYKEYTVYTTNGWADTQNNNGMLYDYSVITSENGKRITADSIAFNKEQGWAKAYHEVDIQDSAKKVIVRGNYGIFYRNPQAALITQKPYAIEYSSGDSLFLHADTLSFAAPDSLNKIMKAYHHVRFFRSDFQGKCDSLVYITKDSVVDMYKDPVIWSEQNQLTGDIIKIYMNGNMPDWIHITSNAMISAQEDSVNFNQLSGRESKGYIIDNQLRKIEMIGNAVSIYFPKDSDGALVGVNKAESSFMTIFMNNKKLEKIIMTPDSQGVLYPPSKAPKDELFLRNFTWQEQIRPKSKEDIFRIE